jgi:hypothetical protein
MPQTKRAAAEVAGKKASDIITSEDKGEEVIIIDESKQSNLEPKSSKEKPIIAGAAAKEKLHASKETVNTPKDSSMKGMEKMADKEENAQTAKFDKTRKVRLKIYFSYICVLLVQIYFNLFLGIGRCGCRTASKFSNLSVLQMDIPILKTYIFFFHLSLLLKVKPKCLKNLNLKRIKMLVCIR